MGGGAGVVFGAVWGVCGGFGRRVVRFGVGMAALMRGNSPFGAGEGRGARGPFPPRPGEKKELKKNREKKGNKREIRAFLNPPPPVHVGAPRARAHCPRAGHAA